METICDDDATVTGMKKGEWMNDLWKKVSGVVSCWKPIVVAFLFGALLSGYAIFRIAEGKYIPIVAEMEGTIARVGNEIAVLAERNRQLEVTEKGLRDTNARLDEESRKRQDIIVQLRGINSGLASESARRAKIIEGIAGSIGQIDTGIESLSGDISEVISGIREVINTISVIENILRDYFSQK